jgi:hypothetical protein
MFKPQAPTMGSLFQVSSTDWCAWIGGKPKADWLGLNANALTDPNENFQFRPSSPGSSQKSTSYCEMSLEIKFKRDNDLLDFAKVVEAYLRRARLDTSITYQVDPQDHTAVLSNVTDYAKFDL